MSRRTITYERLLKRDKKYRNFRFFFTVILITAGVLFIRHVDTRLAEYESSLPDQTVKTFIQAIENNDYTSVNHDAITEEAFSSLCSLAKNGTITFRKIIQPNVNEHHYQLQQNGNQIILLKLQIRPAMKDEHYDRWNINSVEFCASAEQTAADVLTAFENRDFSLIYESVDPGLYACETQSDFESFLYSAVDGKTFSLSESDTSTDTEKVFVYLLDGERFFTAKMQKNERNGNVWTVTSGEAHFINPVLYAAEIPSGAHLTVNGMPASDVFKKGTVESIHASHMSQSVENPVNLSLTRYEFPFAFSTPTFSVTDENGEELSTTIVDNTLYAASNKILPEFSFIEESAEKAAEVIARFFVGKSKIGAALVYVEKDSPAHTILYEYSLWKSVNAGSAKMESFEVTGMTKLGDNCLAVEIHAMFHASYSTENVLDYPLNYTFYYHKVGTKWLIYDFVSK